jgi:hypothetical protein
MMTMVAEARAHASRKFGRLFSAKAFGPSILSCIPVRFCSNQRPASHAFQLRLFAARMSLANLGSFDQIRAGAKGSVSGTRNDRDAGHFVVAVSLERVAHGGCHSIAQGIHTVRPVHGDDPNLAVFVLVDDYYGALLLGVPVRTHRVLLCLSILEREAIRGQPSVPSIWFFDGVGEMTDGLVG